MNLEHLRAVSKVAQLGSITEAAAELNLTQSGVSRQIQKVEQELGIRLFDRSHGRIQLTPAGERFRVFADDTLAEYDRLVRELREGTQPSLSGPLRISASTAPGESLVGELVAGFIQLHENVSPRILISDTAAVIEDLRERRSDVGFTGDVDEGSRLHFQPICGDEIVLAVPRGHRFAGRGEIELMELAGEPFLVREAGSGTSRTVQAALASQGERMPAHRVVMELSSTNAIISAIARGAGLGWVSTEALRDRDLSQIATVKIKGLPLTRSLYIVYDQQRVLPPAARAFIDWAVVESERVLGSA